MPFPMKSTPDPRLLHGLAACGALLIVLVSWQFAYRPALAAYRQDQTRIAALEEEVATTEAMVSAAGGMVTWMADHRQQLGDLQGRFPSHTKLPELLNALAEEFRTTNVTLAGIAQGNLEPVLDDNQELVLVDGAACLRLPVTVTSQGTYHAVLAVLDRIMSESFGSVVSLEQMQLRALAPPSPKLAVSLQLFLYVVRSPTLPESPDA